MRLLHCIGVLLVIAIVKMRSDVLSSKLTLLGSQRYARWKRHVDGLEFDM